MRLVSPDTANFSYLVLAGYALFGRVQALQALALSWLFTMLSEGIAPMPSTASLGRYAVMAGAAVSLLLRSGMGQKRGYLSRPILATVALGIFLIIHSILFSPLADVSILKAVAWTVVMVVLLSAWMGLDSRIRAQLERQFFYGLVLLILISIPLVFTDIGYMRNGTGFQGVLSHPQIFGPTVALLCAWVAGRLLGTTRPRWVDVALLGLCLMLVVMSEARVAGLALVLGVASAGLVSPFIAGIPARQLMPGLASWRLQALALISAVVLVFVGPALSHRLGTYLQKRSDAVSLREVADVSRGLTVRTMMANFEENPQIGIGFGIASDPSTMKIDRDSVFGLPTSGTIEKGVLPIAVLEELGVFGFILVGAWLLLMVVHGARSGFAAFAVLASLLLMNLGESTLFSAGGMGLLPLILLAWAVTGRHHVLQERDCA